MIRQQELQTKLQKTKNSINRTYVQKLGDKPELLYDTAKAIYHYVDGHTHS